VAGQPPSEHERPQRLRIEAGQEGDTYIVRCSGELDESGCEELEDALAQAEASDAAHILLDLDPLEFIDSAGLRVLVSASRRTADDGGRFRMTRGTGEVAKLFELVALDRTARFV
jgi:anti-sigma B factor antagonist